MPDAKDGTPQKATVCGMLLADNAATKSIPAVHNLLTHSRHPSIFEYQAHRHRDDRQLLIVWTVREDILEKMEAHLCEFAASRQY
jgi:hypothetical protein